MDSTPSVAHPDLLPAAARFNAAIGRGWSGEAQEVLARACERHGGVRAWDTTTGLSIELLTLAGALVWMKGGKRTFPLPRRFEVWPQQGVVVFVDYPAPRVGVYRRGDVQLLHEGAVIDESVDHRRTFDGLAKLRSWSPLDALYFFGYALSHYHSLPFSLLEGQALRVRHTHDLGAALTGIEVLLPAELPTHCRKQTFWFDESGLLRRHDYVADIVGRWVAGAHAWSDYAALGDGRLVARHRRVVARIGSLPTPFVALNAQFGDIKVVDEPRVPLSG